MNKASTFKKVLISILLLLSTVIVSGCGGGGGGDGGGGVNTGITYTGVTTQATIDENNAVEITLEAYEGVDTASELNILGAVSENSSSVKNPLFVDISTY